MFKDVARFLNSTGKEVKKMRKVIAILPIVMVIGAVTTASAFAASDTVTVSARVKQASTTEISIAIKDAETGGNDLTSIDFGTVPNSATDHRTKQTSPAGGAWVDYFAGAGTHEIRVWFDNYPGVTNDPTKAIAGLKATVGNTDYFWPVKVWCANYGPAGYDNRTGGANPDNETYWNENYSWIFERAYKVDGFGNTGLPSGYPSDIYKDETRTKLSWYYPAGTPTRSGIVDARLPSRYRVDLAIDALDAQYAGQTATTYSGTLTFDITQTP